MKNKFLLVFLLCFAVVAFRSAEDALFVVPSNFPKPVYDFAKNPLSENKIQLGRALFYDPILSRNNMISCASCHSQFSAFAHVDHALSHGIEDKIGFRNSPSLMNLAWQKLFMRDGAINHLDVQALAPMSNPVEMDENITHVVSKLQASNLYPKLFYKAFGDSIITGEHALKAISQFMLTLISANSKYDSVMRKQTEFTTQENNGYSLFKKNCSSCHAEPLFTNDDFRNNGLSVDTTLNDFGRYRVTKNPSDSLKFKVPTLRNIEFSYPYMHDGRFKRLTQVLNHYTDGIEKSKTLSSELQQPIVLSANEKVDIVAFLLTLTDKSFLFNPNYFYPKEIFSAGAKD
ncbi:MAG: cytochrome c peroxidase [Bacteroidota bacterium]